MTTVIILLSLWLIAFVIAFVFAMLHIKFLNKLYDESRKNVGDFAEWGDRCLKEWREDVNKLSGRIIELEAELEKYTTDRE